MPSRTSPRPEQAKIIQWVSAEWPGRYSPIYLPFLKLLKLDEAIVLGSLFKSTLMRREAFDADLMEDEDGPNDDWIEYPTEHFLDDLMFTKKREAEIRRKLVKLRVIEFRNNKVKVNTERLAALLHKAFQKKGWPR